MSAQTMPLIRADEVLLNADGTPTNRFFLFLTGARNRLGGDDDKVDAAHALATAAVPQTTQVIGGGGLALGGTLTGNVGLAFYKVVTTVAQLPTASNTEGDWAYAADGRKPGEGAGVGTGAPATWSNGNWVSVFDGATVAA